ncbi:MAG: ABC transporter substrate-binding protein [Chloroflexota bacterium]|nr:ABC transporter substrate-binding protein [Chloroflexota bacterium]
MNTRYSRRRALSLGLGSLGSLTLLSLAGCETLAQPLANQGNASMRMFFWGSAARNQLTTRAIDLFHQNHPSITITSQYSGNDTYYTKLDAQIAHGQTPDLIQMDMRYISGYVRKGILLELSELIYDQAINLTDFDAGQIIGSKVNNGIYGVSLGSNYQCMFYDKTRLTKAGFEPPTVGMTWEEFSPYLINLSAALGKGSYGSSDSSGNYDNFEIWIRQRGKELYTVEGLLGFELAEVADWYNYWDTLRKAGGCPPGHIQASLDLTGTPVDSSVIKGIAVFSHIFSNQYVAFQAATPHPLVLSAYPAGTTPGMYIKVSQLLSIAANTKYQEDAASFVSFLVTNPGAVKALGFERGVPASAAALAYLKPAFTPAQQTIVNFMDYVATSGVARTKVVLDPPGAAHVATSLLQVAQQVGSGSLSVSAGAQAFYTQAQKATQPG